MSNSAASRGARGAGMVMIAQVGMLALQMLGTIVLSRILLPEDFGLMAIVLVLMGIGALIRDFGMGTASLQEQNLSQQQASNLFWVNAALSGGTAVLLAASAPIVAHVFNDSRLIVVVPFMAVILLLTGLQTQYQALLSRRRKFGVLASSGISAVSGGFIAGVVSALLGAGYWALVAQQAAIALVTLCIYVGTTKWKPSRPRRDAESRNHIASGTHYGIAHAIGYVADNADTLVIGYFWSSAEVGAYDRAFKLFMQPVAAIFGPLTQVVVPTLSRLRAAGRNTADVLIEVQSGLVGGITLLLLATSASSDWLIPLLIGPGWELAVTLMQILALGGVFKALSQINYWAYVATKSSKTLLKSNLVTKPLQIALVVAGALLGDVHMVAWGFVIGRALSWPINLIWLARVAEMQAWRAFMNGMRIVVCGVVAYFVSRWIAIHLPPMSNLTMTFIIALMSVLLFMLVFVLIPGGFKEMCSIRRMARAMFSR